MVRIFIYFAHVYIFNLALNLSYGALFGPQLFGHGTKVESHKSFGRPENKLYNGMTRYKELTLFLHVLYSHFAFKISS